MSKEDNRSKETRSGRAPAMGWRNLVLSTGENYFRGLVALGISYALWRGIQTVSAKFEDFDGQSTVLLLLAVLLLPPALGWMIRHLIYPWMKRVHVLRAVLRSEERLFAEFAPDSRRGFPVALLNWPNERVRAFCLITATYPGPEPGREFAAVYLPGSPDVRRGNLRVVPLEELEILDWSLAEGVRMQITCGTHSPGYLHKP